MHEEVIEVTGGVDTHSRVHVAAVISSIGRVLGAESFPVTRDGYRLLLEWMQSFGTVVRVGIEGTGGYGAGLSRFLLERDVSVIEVNRPNRQLRRRRGKSDTTDAEWAVRAVLSGDATAIPKRANGRVEALRSLKVARRSAVKAMTQASHQIRDLIVSAPDELRERLMDLSLDKRIEACVSLGDVADQTDDVYRAMTRSLRCLARRWKLLDAEVTELDEAIQALCVAENPALLGACGVGPETAASLLVAAGDNPERMHSEAGFAALIGVSPVQASSGKTVRHRLNRGGNREANTAVWQIVRTRLRCEPTTQAYRDKRRAQGKTDPEIIRSLKRYVAREMYRMIINPPTVISGPELPAIRTNNNINLITAAKNLQTWPARLSRLERGLDHNNQLATRYHQWLQTTALQT